MKTLIKKHTLLLCSGLVLVNLLSCNEDEPPCTDQTLKPLSIVLMDQDDTNLMDEEAGYEPADFELFYLDEEDEEVGIDYELKTTSEEEAFLESLEASQESLDGENTLFLRIAEDWVVEFEYVVTNTTTSGCDVFSYEASDEEGEELDRMEEGNPKPYIISVETPEE